MVSQGTCPNLESSPTLGLEILYFIQMGGSLYFIIPVCAHVLCPHPHIPWVTSVIHDLHSDFYFSCLTRSHHSYPELMDRLSSESLPMIWKAKTVVYPCSNPFGLHGKLGQLSKLNIFWWKKRVFSGNSTYWSKQVGSLSGNLQCRGNWDAAGSCKRWVRLKIRQPQMPCFIILSSQNHGSSCCLSKKNMFCSRFKFSSKIKEHHGLSSFAGMPHFRTWRFCFLFQRWNWFESWNQLTWLVAFF